LFLARGGCIHIPKTSLSSIDVLIAEDDAITRMTLRRLLQAQGYRCAEAADGVEALEIARQNPPRLLLLDVMMPILDGFEVARQMRNEPATRGVKILFLTGRNDEGARSLAWKAGRGQLLTKPIDFDWLLDVVITALKNGRPKRAVRSEQPPTDLASTSAQSLSETT
jgi:two-component system, OmpR family, phosphate regulon response regulator PhoB